MNTSLQPMNRMATIKDLEKEIEGKYLTEELLGKFLQVAYPEYEWVHDRKFETPDGIKYNFRPDYCCHELKMSVEFDGPDHFTKANIIQADETKDSILRELGYRVVRIPYFIQLDCFSIKHFFGIDFLFCNCFPHGFVSRNVTLPASFCEQGIWKFKSLIFTLDMYEETGHIFDGIANSLIAKIHQNAKKVPFEKAVLNVVPSSVAFDLRLKGLNQALINNHKLEKSNLGNNWNCVILESSQKIKNYPNVFDLIYIYNSKGNIEGYFFCLLQGKNKVKRITILFEEILGKTGKVIIKLLEDEKDSKTEKLASSVTVDSIVDLIFCK